MSSKTEEYLVLAQRTANGLTRYWESWTDYLTTASRLHYVFDVSDTGVRRNSRDPEVWQFNASKKACLLL